ncbi:heme biosynthesis protein [Bordetella pertussis]|nr:heme biosynthesis protein [Bordetella pertussis]
MTLLKDLLADPGLPRLEARMLAEHVLGRSRAWLLAHDTDPVEPAHEAAWRQLAARRLAGELRRACWTWAPAAAPSPCRWRWVARRPR